MVEKYKNIDREEIAKAPESLKFQGQAPKTWLSALPLPVL